MTESKENNELPSFEGDSSSEVTIPELARASIESGDRLVLAFKSQLSHLPPVSGFQTTPPVPLRRIERLDKTRIVIDGGPFELTTSYRITLPDGGDFPLLPDGVLDRIATDRDLGLIWKEGVAHIRLFAPRATAVEAIFLELPGDEPYERIEMEYDPADGTWETCCENVRPGHLYGYRVKGPPGEEDLSGIIFADPYSIAVAKRNTWQRESLSVVYSPEVLDSEAEDHLFHDERDLVIYEAHLRDLSILSMNIPPHLRGTYKGVIFPGDGTPLAHLDRLGVNTIELLPLQDYDYFEPPYDERTHQQENNWNRYSRNHWGYMPGYYFAPEPRYGTGASDREGDWIGVDGHQVFEMREMVKGFHKAGLSVILDVVYNHVANYGQNPIRQIDPLYSLRVNREGQRMSESGCGNDLRTSRPMIRRLIIDSLRHWVRFYGIDGFRFDLGGLIDADTLDEIGNRLRGEFPKIVLIAEPWGGLYDKKRFTTRGWASWNDLFRDSIRGPHPIDNPGILFSRKSDKIDKGFLLRQVCGNTRATGGPYLKESHSVNYLASHDGFNFSDFNRIVSGRFDGRKSKRDDPFTRLLEQEIRRLRLGYFILFTSRGMAMIHQGDEWGRKKLIEETGVSDPRVWELDRDSYNKDNETSWLDWSDLELPECSKLAQYVSGLIALRNTHPALRHAQFHDIQLLDRPDDLTFGYRIRHATEDLAVLLNFHPDREAGFKLPEGRWTVLADHHQTAGHGVTGGMRIGKATLPPLSGALLACETTALSS